MTPRVQDPASARRLAASLLADVVKVLSGTPPSGSSPARLRAVRTWYRDAVVDLLWLHSPSAAVWTEAVGLDVDLFRSECERRGFVRDPWTAIPISVRTKIGDRPPVFDDLEKERRLLRFLESLDRAEAA